MAAHALAPWDERCLAWLSSTIWADLQNLSLTKFEQGQPYKALSCTHHASLIFSYLGMYMLFSSRQAAASAALSLCQARHMTAIAT